MDPHELVPAPVGDQSIQIVNDERGILVMSNDAAVDSWLNGAGLGMTPGFLRSFEVVGTQPVPCVRFSIAERENRLESRYGLCPSIFYR
jgi:hypothetical protein